LDAHLASGVVKLSGRVSGSGLALGPAAISGCAHPCFWTSGQAHLDSEVESIQMRWKRVMVGKTVFCPWHTGCLRSARWKPHHRVGSGPDLWNMYTLTTLLEKAVVFIARLLEPSVGGFIGLKDAAK